ncbi:MAG: hypothetical protein R3C20_15340 [Planctomycetaceae bacterium]
MTDCSDNAAKFSGKRYAEFSMVASALRNSARGILDSAEVTGPTELRKMKWISENIRDPLFSV